MAAATWADEVRGRDPFVSEYPSTSYDRRESCGRGDQKPTSRHTHCAICSTVHRRRALKHSLPGHLKVAFLFFVAVQSTTLGQARCVWMQRAFCRVRRLTLVEVANARDAVAAPLRSIHWYRDLRIDQY
jgi:hypothetical protein